ncbi:hypothetical protein C8R44DRAFT_744649 [Mycena epipterygia]|nr:hypothetical protein C8R44DRAFT_744649 [Mycena epipterygia]
MYPASYLGPLVYIQSLPFNFSTHTSLGRGPAHCSLRVLVLRDIALCYAPIWDDFTSVFRSAMHLEKMCIRNVGYQNIPEVGSHGVELSALTDLDLSFDSDVTFGWVLSHLRLPALNTFKFIGNSNEEVDALARYGITLTTVKNFIFDGDIDERDFMMHALLNMPSISSLDLLSSEFAVLEALLAADRLVTSHSGLPKVREFDFFEGSRCGSWAATQKYRTWMDLPRLVATGSECTYIACCVECVDHRIFEYAIVLFSNTSLKDLISPRSQIPAGTSIKAYVDSPRAWSKIPICLYTKSRFVRLCLTRSTQADLSLHFYLLPLDHAGPYHKQTAKDVVETMFTLLDNELFRIRCFSIACSDAKAYISIMAWMSKIDVRRLTRLSVVIAPPFEIRRGGSPFMLPLPLQAPNLRVLRLGQSVPLWNASTVYINITMLRLTAYQSYFSMSWTTISRVLSTMPNLEMLHLFDVECNDIYSEDADVLVLPHLTDLLLSFSHQSSALLASHLRMPGLTGLRLDIRGTHYRVRPATRLATVQEFVSLCRPMLEHIIVADVCLRDIKLSETTELFPAMKKLQRIDTSRCPDSTRHSFSEAAKSLLCSWPDLDLIRVGHIMADTDKLALLQIQSQGRLAPACVLISPTFQPRPSSGFEFERNFLISGKLFSRPLDRNVEFGNW